MTPATTAACIPAASSRSGYIQKESSDHRLEDRPFRLQVNQELVFEEIGDTGVFGEVEFVESTIVEVVVFSLVEGLGTTD